MDIDDKIKAILNSPDGQAYYRERTRRGGPRAKDKLRRKKATLKPKRGSWKDALRLHTGLKKRLKKHGESKQDTALLKIISACTKGRRCADAACPKCNYAVQGVMNELHLDMREGGFVFDKCITIIPSLFFEPSDEAGRGAEAAVAKVFKIRGWLDDAYDQSGVTNVIGGIDFNYHEFPHDKFKEHCRPHFHGLGFAVQFKAGEKRLRGAFARTKVINKSVQIEPYDGADNWRHYMIKIPNSRLKRKRDKQTGKWAPSDYKDLTVVQQLQQAVVLHEIGWAGRLYLRGVELIEGRKGWRLVLTEFTPAVQKRGR